MLNWAKLNWGTWSYGLLGGTVTSAASTVSAAIGIPLANATKLVDIPPLNMRQLGALAVISAITGACAYLKQSPLPKEEDNPTTANSGDTTIVNK